jgi:hypothetical protein
MAKFAFGGGNPGAARPFIMAGPEVGYLLSAETTDSQGQMQFYIPALAGGAVDINEVDGLGSTGADLKDDIESLEYAFNFGGGIIFPLGQAQIFLDGWYSLGLSNIFKDVSEEDSEEVSVNVKNSVVMLNLGLIF